MVHLVNVEFLKISWFENQYGVFLNLMTTPWFVNPIYGCVDRLSEETREARLARLSHSCNGQNGINSTQSSEYGLCHHVYTIIVFYACNFERSKNTLQAVWVFAVSDFGFTAKQFLQAIS